jgi:hypothetical protein
MILVSMPSYRRWLVTLDIDHRLQIQQHATKSCLIRSITPCRCPQDPHHFSPVDFKTVVNHSKPSYNPSPEMELHPCTCHFRSDVPWSFRPSMTAEMLIANGRSCLLAKTSRGRPASSGSANRVCSMLRASSMRSRSLESTT